MNRRHFIVIGTAGAAAIAIPAGYFFFRDIQYNRSLADPQSLALIWDNQMIISAGKQYRLQTPGEESERSLAKRLLAVAPDNYDTDPSGIEKEIAKDFKTGNTVIVDGWILSRTEARQCALFSMVQTK